MSKDKKRRSFLDQPLDAIEKAGKQIMNETKETPKPKVEKVVAAKPKPKPTKTSKPKAKEVVAGKRKFVYLDEAVHREAKVKAASTGKTIKQFITDLILNSNT